MSPLVILHPSFPHRMTMSELVMYIRPYDVPEQSHSTLLSLLKEKGSRIGVESTTIIPVLKSSDVDDIVRNNTTKVTSGVKAPSGVGSNVNAPVQDNEHQDEADEMEVDEEMTRFVPLEDLVPTNLKQEVTTVCVKSFPNVKGPSIEKIFSILFENSPFGSSKQLFQWSMLTNEHTDDRYIYIRFYNLDVAKWFIDNAKEPMSQISDKISIVSDSSGESYLEAPSEEKRKKSDFSQQLVQMRRILNNSKNHENTSKKTGLEDLDEVLQHYNTYTVEQSELVDVPKDMKKKIVKDIIKFRSKVLTIEKDRRKREIEIERRKAKNRLQMIFEGIKETSALEKGEDEVVEAEEEDGESMEDKMDEEEFLKYTQEVQDKALEEEYAKKVGFLQNREQTEKLPLVEKLKKLVNYENNLIDNKFVYIEEFRNFDDLSAESISSNISKAPRYKLNFTNHSEYIRLRNKERAREEELDAADELKEMAEAESVQAAQNFISSFRNNQPKAEAEADVEAEEMVEAEVSEDAEMVINVVISNLPDQQLQLINDKIGELIEEYLGIRELVLIDFIFDFIKTKNLTAKEELINELDETLDEDSVIVVKELWNFIIELTK